jgi:hypothetical protein
MLRLIVDKGELFEEFAHRVPFLARIGVIPAFFEKGPTMNFSPNFRYLLTW